MSITTEQLEAMLAAATPGPWICYADIPSADPNWHIVTTANKLRVLANVHIEPGNSVDPANAAIIAAAPTITAELIAARRKLEAVQAIVAAERERCAVIADAYADENITMAGDSVLHDPVLSNKRGKILTADDFAKSESMILDGCIHSSMFHAAQNIAAAIRADQGVPT